MQSYTQKPRRLVMRLGCLALAAGLAVGGGFTWQSYQASLVAPAAAQEDDSGGGGRPPVTVATAKAQSRTWQPGIRATGSLAAVRGVSVVADISGLVTDIRFTSGDTVARGTPLVQLRDEEARAELAALKARRDQRKSQFERDRRLYQQGNQSEAQLDLSRAQYQELQAEIRRQEARIAKTTVRAPFDGRLGLREVNLGQYVSPGTSLVTLQDLTPLHVNFSLPEQRLPEIKRGQPVEVRVDAYPETVFKGEITAINPKVEVETRQVRIQATLGNDDERLRPGMFARVEVILPARENVITLPQTAIVNQPYGDLVYVVQPPAGDGAPRRVKQRYITTGAKRGTQIAVTNGLDGGEEVVSAGQLKLRDKAAVRVDNDVQPDNEAEATPEEP